MPSNIVNMQEWVKSRRETTITKGGNITPTPMHPYPTADDHARNWPDGLCRNAIGVKTRRNLKGFDFSDRDTHFILPVVEYQVVEYNFN